MKEARATKLLKKFLDPAERFDGKEKSQVDLLCVAEQTLQLPKFESCQGVKFLNQAYYVLYDLDSWRKSRSLCGKKEAVRMSLCVKGSLHGLGKPKSQMRTRKTNSGSQHE